MAVLTTFLQAVVAHPYLRDDLAFRMFLSKEEWKSASAAAVVDAESAQRRCVARVCVCGVCVCACELMRQRRPLGNE